jgi:hypothetical protein
MDIPQAGQRAGAGRTTANFCVSDLAVVSQHPYWTYLMDFGRWVGPLGGPIYVKQSLVALPVPRVCRRAAGHYYGGYIFFAAGRRLSLAMS